MQTSNAPTKQSQREGRVLAVVVWLIGMAIVGIGSRRWLPPLASEHGAGIDSMLNYLMITVGALVLSGHLVVGWFLWRFGRGQPVSFRLASWRIERRWSLVPVVLLAVVAEGGVLALGLPVWAKIYGEPPAGSLTVEVTGEQFAWNVRYAGADGKFGRTLPKRITLDNPLGLDSSDPASADDIIALNEIRVPVNRPVRIRLRSKDVLHSFYLPYLRVKQDAVPGMNIELWFVPTRTGTFELACAELCGLGHYEMRGLLFVLLEEQFQHWLKEQKNG